ncbi:MAG: MOSC domain-containing protein [Verrucomicrobiota bacterium]
MRVLHVNRSLPTIVEINGKPVATGIYKQPVSGPVAVHPLGLEGDGQADLTVHRGEHQAVYAYPVEHYAAWEAELAAGPYPPGTFGENLTTSGLLEADVCIGDIHRIGTLVLQVTSARIPCFKLGHKLGRPDILKRFLHSRRSGFYYKVCEPGIIEAGAGLDIITRDSRQVSVSDLLGMHRLGEGDPALLRRVLEIEALSPSVRRDLEARLAK